MKGYPKVGLGLVGIVVLGAVVFFGMMVATDPGDNLRLVESSFTSGPSGIRLVAGAIRNETDGPYFHVQMEIDFLDAEDDVVGSTSVERSNLGSGETWSFEVPILAEVVVRARLRDLLCSKTEGPPDPRACRIPPTLISLSE
ncbi:MAG: FxLYD domain-containing protein [Longimicrobiales bacterium]|nr:FxLYD domain-containing protein [Longimicrobiales bacterium]